MPRSHGSEVLCAELVLATVALNVQEQIETKGLLATVPAWIRALGKLPLVEVDVSRRGTDDPRVLSLL